MAGYSGAGQPSLLASSKDTLIVHCFVGSFAKNYTVQLLAKLRDDKGLPKS